MKKITVLVSGGGTNLQALIDAANHHKINHGAICSVISSKPGVFALNRAQENGISTKVVDRKSFSTGEAFNKALLKALLEEEPDLIVLAGFLCILSPEIIKMFHNRIINVHPSLIPSFCGDGYYGLRVHEAALEKGVKITGATVHFVNEITDGGAIILQKAVPILQGDTPEILQKRVMEEAEWVILPEAVELFCEDKLLIDGNQVFVKES